MLDLASQATKAAVEGDWQKAVELNSIILSGNPKDIEALNRLAHALSALGKTKEAKQTYQKALSFDPYNYIAQKNLKKLSAFEEEATEPKTNHSCLPPCLFLEEPGKTKVVSVVNPAQQRTLACLSPGDPLELVFKKHSILVYKNGSHLGALPDDLAFRLINLSRLGNKYGAYVKAIEENNLNVFLKEVKKGKRVGNQPSFPQGQSGSFFPFVYGKHTLDIDREPPETNLEDEEEMKDDREIEET